MPPQISLLLPQGKRSFKPAQARQYLHVFPRLTSEDLAAAGQTVFPLQKVKGILLLIDEVQFDRLCQILPLLFVPVARDAPFRHFHKIGVRQAFHRFDDPAAGALDASARDIIPLFALVQTVFLPFFSRVFPSRLSCEIPFLIAPSL